jgi:hypothetical protein
MQRLEVSGAVRPLYGSLGVKQLKELPRCGSYGKNDEVIVWGSKRSMNLTV